MVLFLIGMIHVLIETKYSHAVAVTSLLIMFIFIALALLEADLTFVMKLNDISYIKEIDLDRVKRCEPCDYCNDFIEQVRAEQRLLTNAELDHVEEKYQEWLDSNDKQKLVDYFNAT